MNDVSFQGAFVPLIKKDGRVLHIKSENLQFPSKLVSNTQQQHALTAGSGKLLSLKFR